MLLKVIKAEKKRLLNLSACFIYLVTFCIMFVSDNLIMYDKILNVFELLGIFSVMYMYLKFIIVKEIRFIQQFCRLL